MGFCIKENALIANGYTVIDNSFLISHLPNAPENTLKVYLLGLALSDVEENTAEQIAFKLDLKVEDVIDAFLYWEELGFVHVVKSNPPQVVFLAQNGDSSAKKIKPSKYAKFNADIQSVIKDRMLSITELNEYYSFLENNVFEPSALVAVAKYCVEIKGNAINYPYILTVARSQIKKGNTTFETVSEDLNAQYKYDDDLQILFKVLKIRRKIDHADRLAFEKWTKDFDFLFDVILFVAKDCIDGGMKKLNALLSEYFKKGVKSKVEIESYTKQRTELLSLAKTVTKNLGAYFQCLDPVIDEYICDWKNKGFNDETIVVLSKYCFRSGIRKLEQMHDVVEKFYRGGIVSLESINATIYQRKLLDDKIKNVLSKLGLVRNVSASDRRIFSVWTDEWKIGDDLLDYAIEKSVGAVNAMPYLGKVLADFKANGIKTVEQAKQFALSVATTAVAKEKQSFAQREYTDEEITALFSDLDKVDF